MKPATPLPWVQDPTGDAGSTYIGSPNVAWFTADCYKKKDAAYIVHACNAYPQLIALLKGTHHNDSRAHIINEFLRELGELR